MPLSGDRFCKLRRRDDERRCRVMLRVARHQLRKVVLRGKGDAVENLVVRVGEPKIVGLCNCENVRLCNYGIVMPTPCRYDAGSKNARQFLGFVDKIFKLGFGNIGRFSYNLEPYAAFGKFLHRNLEFVYEIFTRLGLCRFGVIGGNTCGRTKQLVGKAAAAYFARWQCATDIYATRGKSDGYVFEFMFCHGRLQSHNFTIPQFHYPTIPQSFSRCFCVLASSGKHSRVPISNGIFPFRRHAFANMTNAVVIDMPTLLQNSLKSLLRSSSMRMLNAVCAISIPPVCENEYIVPYFAADSRREGAFQARFTGLEVES